MSQIPDQIIVKYCPCCCRAWTLADALHEHWRQGNRVMHVEPDPANSYPVSQLLLWECDCEKKTTLALEVHS